MEEKIRVKYWGVRGSIPSPLTCENVKTKQMALLNEIVKLGMARDLLDKFDEKKVSEFLDELPVSISGTYGGDTTCVEIQVKDSPLIVIDAGTGIRNLGSALLGRLFTKGNLNPLNAAGDSESKKDIHLFFSHYHWDHLQGFPFFAPGFIPGNARVNIHLYGKSNADKHLSDVLAGQQEYPNFPVHWDDMPCAKSYNELGRLEPKSIKIGKASVLYQELTHPDSVFAYSISCDDKKFVFASDTEHKNVADPRLIKLAKDADVLYYDAQYTPAEYIGTAGTLTGAMTKFDWGHSTFEWGIQNAIAANVKTLVIGHHEPMRNDFQLEELLEKALEYKDGLAATNLAAAELKVVLARQGMEHVL